MGRSFKTILVANRGEIAVRVFRSATELGLRTVAIYSHEDRLCIHRYKADEAWQIGEEGQPLQAYLDMDAIIEIAKSRNVDAIHPGYGFLSENGEFARRCAQANIVFVGPPPKVLDGLGDKVAARQLAMKAGVPIIPGTDTTSSNLESAMGFAKEIGYPVMIKAAFGGGGRGMRRANNSSELKEGLAAAKREAKSAFGNDALFIEKYIEQPRHIEVQLLGDHTGNLVHLFERDCSIQRRHQKVVEVAPAVHLDDDLRAKLFEAAIAIGKHAGLVNAATVEFLVDKHGAFYFIEVNPRLQVEHTITELITGIDIVSSQLQIAQEKTLDDLGIGEQQNILSRGHAIQGRITTEDPANNFAPDTGRVTAYRAAAGMGIRLDTGIAGAGAEITPYYDSLLVKVCAFGLTHKQAAMKLSRSLKEFRIRGVSTNIRFLDNIISHPEFLEATVDTEFLIRFKELFQMPLRRNRANRILTGLADTIVNGPPGVDTHLERPQIQITPPRLSRVVTLKEMTAKHVLDADGPDAVATWVREQKRVLITDTTIRDAHQSLFATRMRTYDMMQVAEAMEDRLNGAFSVECWGGATFDVAFRFLREDPWDRLRRLRAAMPNTLLQMLLRGSNAVGYANYPENVIRRFVQLAAETGVDVFRIFDCFNQLEAMASSIDEVRQVGKIAEVSICYTGDLEDASRPLYTIDYYKRKAHEMAKAGAHILAIKDMAGLLKPRAAHTLITALRAEVDCPIHVHTHDSAGNGVAMLLAAVDAGADIIDTALASMSGLTSQPNLNSIAAALQGHERDTLLNMTGLQELSDYWEAVRTHYAPFESGLKSSGADVYHHEIPGGQYSNLKPQALAVGLAAQWTDIRETYRDVNFALGDIIKVTPSSKVVGDFALWLVRNELSMEKFLGSEKHYDLPKSVVEFFQGAIGVPEGGFPEEVRKRVLGPDCGPAPTGYASVDMPPYDFKQAHKTLDQMIRRPVTDTLMISYALYPKVVSDYIEYRKQCGDVDKLDTGTFFYGLDPDKEIRVDLEPGKTLIVSLIAIGEVRHDGTREVLFMLNGQPRSVRVKDKLASLGVEERPKADPNNINQIPSPMPGSVWSIAVQAGSSVAEGEILGVVEAMKLETNIRAPKAGIIKELVCEVGDRIKSGDLLFIME